MSYETERDATYALLAAAGMRPLDVTSDVWSAALTIVRAGGSAPVTPELRHATAVSVEVAPAPRAPGYSVTVELRGQTSNGVGSVTVGMHVAQLASIVERAERAHHAAALANVIERGKAAREGSA